MANVKYYNPAEPPSYEEATSAVPVVYAEYAPPPDTPARGSNVSNYLNTSSNVNSLPNSNNSSPSNRNNAAQIDPRLYWREATDNRPVEYTNLGHHGVRLRCPYCSKIIVTKVKKRTSDTANVLAMLLCIFGCFICSIIPLMMDSLKSKFHYCPRCKKFLGKTIIS